MTSQFSEIRKLESIVFVRRDTNDIAFSSYYRCFIITIIHVLPKKTIKCIAAAEVWQPLRLA